MSLTDNFIPQKMPDDPVEAVLAVCEAFSQYQRTYPAGTLHPEVIDGYIEFYGLLRAMKESYGLSYKLPPIESIPDEGRIIGLLSSAIDTIKAELHSQRRRTLLYESERHFAAKISGGFAYEFSDSDLKRVQQLINELRDFIAASEQIEANHKSRLLARLEKLQKELHKRVGSIDQFWAFLGDAGVVLGKFGIDVKPLTDRIGEMMQIISNVQVTAIALPSSTPSPKLTFDDKNVGS